MQGFGGCSRKGLITTFAIALAGCGSAGSTTSTSPSPHQSDNSQRDVAYARAVNQIMAPFSKPPANPTDYVTAGRELSTAIHSLGSLSVPQPFASNQAHLVAALRAQVSLIPRLERAARAHDRAAQNNIEAQNLRDSTRVRAAIQEMIQTYDRCRSSNFSDC